MSKLDELIAELCLDGVEYKILIGRHCKWIGCTPKYYYKNCK